MNIQLSSLRVSPELDASEYTAGAQQKVAADKAMAASSTEVGQAVAGTYIKITQAGTGISVLERRYVEGAKEAQAFDRDLRRVNTALETGKITTADAAAILVGMNQKLGLSADSSKVAAQGQTLLATAVESANAQIAGQTTALINATAAREQFIARARAEQEMENSRQIAVANQNRFNAVLGVAAPTSGASASASVFQAEFDRLDLLARQRAEQAGEIFAEDFNASVMTTSGKSARASAAVFEEAGREADQMAAKAAALRAELNPLAAAQDRVNAEIAEYSTLAARGVITSEELTRAQALARSRSGVGPRMGRAAGFNAGQQLQDIFMMSALGQNAGVLALQQGPQLASAIEQGGGLSALKTGLMSLLSPTMLLTTGLVGITAAAVQFGSRLSLTNPEAEEFAKWLEQIAGKANTSAEFVGKLAAALGDMSVVDLNKLRRGGAADLESLRAGLSNPLAEAAGYQGALSDPNFIATYRLIDQVIARLRSDDGYKNLEELHRSLAQIVATRPDLQKFAETWEDIGEKAIKAREAMEEAARRADLELHGMGAYQPRDGAAVQKYLDRNADTLFRLQRQRTVDLATIGARSPEELRRAAEMRERAKPVDPNERAEVRNYRIASAGAVAYAQAQHQLQQAQEDRHRSLDATLASQRLDLDLIGKTRGEAAALRFEFQHLREIREEAARNGVDVDEKEIAAIKEKAKQVAALTDAYERQRVAREASLDRAGLFRSDVDNQIARTLEGTGLGLDSVEAAYMRRTAALSEYRDMNREAWLGIGQDIIENGVKPINAVGNALKRLSGRIIDKGITSLADGIFNMVFGRENIALPGLGGARGSSPANPIYVVSVGPLSMGGGISGLFGGGAANDNGSPLAAAARAIKSIESGGNYRALGPLTASGDRAYGAYGIMGANVGPWSKAALGRALSPSELLSNPGAQDAIFNHRFGGYASRFGSMQDAASAWFTGRPISAASAGAKDILGTSGAKYVEMFNSRLSQASDSLGNLSKPVGSLYGAAKASAQGLNSLGGGLDTFGHNLANAFPEAPSGGGGGFFSKILGGLFGGGPSIASMNAISPLATSFILGGGVGLFASGTENAPAGWAWVGEQGPELLKLRGGETIRSHPHSVAMAANSNAANSNQPQRVHITVGWSRTADGNLRPFVEDVAEQKAGQVSTAAIGQYDQGMPGRINDVLERHG